MEKLSRPKCVSAGKLRVDLAGDVFLCHNKGDKLGNIRSHSLTQIEESYDKYLGFSKSVKCQECPVFILCGGGCFLIPEDARNYYYCKFQNVYLTILLDYFLNKLK
jgi:uncharacterized protein